VIRESTVATLPARVPSAVGGIALLLLACTFLFPVGYVASHGTAPDWIRCWLYGDLFAALCRLAAAAERFILARQSNR
jgi:hypothetical protein